MTTLSQIVVYPIKSLDGVSVDAIDVLESGALAWDRRFAIVDGMGQMITGKRAPSIHTLRAAFDLAGRTVVLTRREHASTRRPSDSRRRPSVSGKTPIQERKETAYRTRIDHIHSSLRRAPSRTAVA